MTDHENADDGAPWWDIGGDNLQSVLAYGTWDWADGYADQLNSKKDFGLAWPRLATADQVVDMSARDDGVYQDEEAAK